MSKENISKCFLSPFVIVILALCIFSLACIAFDINVLKIGKSGFFATPTEYNNFIISNTALVFGTYLAMKFFIYLDEALASFYY